MDLVGEKFVQGYTKLIGPVVDWLVKTGVSPNVVTWAGLFFTLVAANFFRLGSFFWGGVFVVVAGTCDMLDGQIARRNNLKSRFGAFFDSTIDRYSDIIVFLGIAVFFDVLYIWALTVLAMTGSLLTSYTRSRAGALKIDCKVGMMQRPERVTYIAGMAVFDAILGWLFDALLGVEHILIILGLWFIAIVANVTVIQRVLHVKHQLDAEDLQEKNDLHTQENL